MRLVLVFVGVATAACVPMAKPMVGNESTLNAPPPPDTRKNATSVLNGTPPLIAPAEPPAPTLGQRRVRGAWRWTGTEYRYIPTRNENAVAPYEWERR